MLAALAVAALLSSAACSAAPDADTARATAQAFYAALDDGDGAAACRALAPHTRAELETSSASSCAAAIIDAGLPAAGAVRSADTFGQGARVVLTNDVVFLSVFGPEWKITAAGCQLRPDLPYDCDLEGG